MRQRSQVSGTWWVLGAYIIWGFLPVYWKALQSVPPIQVLAHRIFWSFVFAALLLWRQKRWAEFRWTFRSPRNRWLVVMTALIIGTNWFLYIWAITNDHVVDTSLGYFINPLVMILLGMLFLRERLNLWQGTACILALAGVLYLTLQYGKIPWIALYLAFSFGFYGLLRKTARVESLIGLAAETGLLSPLLLILILSWTVKGTGVVGHTSLGIHALLIGAGLVTATPLLWYTIGVRRIPLSTAGFLQYLAPSMQLLLGVVVYGEPFTSTHWISFGFIWAGLLVYSISSTSLIKKKSVTRVHKV
jgi:chloramphenicol-sensitive protein RarD